MGKVIRVIISFLLISLNVVYAFENHESEVQVNFDPAIQISSEIHNNDSNDPCHNNQAPIAEHACHLGHCSFFLSSFQFAAKNIVVVGEFFSSQVGLPSPFIDEEVRPPIFS